MTVDQTTIPIALNDEECRYLALGLFLVVVSSGCHPDAHALAQGIAAKLGVAEQYAAQTRFAAEQIAGLN